MPQHWQGASSAGAGGLGGGEVNPHVHRSPGSLPRMKHKHHQHHHHHPQVCWQVFKEKLQLSKNALYFVRHLAILATGCNITVALQSAKPNFSSTVVIRWHSQDAPNTQQRW